MMKPRGDQRLEQLLKLFVYMTEGAAVYNGQRPVPGWASATEVGTPDDDFHSPTGCTFLTVYSE